MVQASSFGAVAAAPRAKLGTLSIRREKRIPEPKTRKKKRTNRGGSTPSGVFTRLPWYSRRRRRTRCSGKTSNSGYRQINAACGAAVAVTLGNPCRPNGAYSSRRTQIQVV